MVITKTHLDRRTFLRGMGATVALPLLDAMTPAGTALAATAARGVPRLAFVYFPHGAIMDAWTPAADGPLTTLGPILEPLAPFADRLTIVSGLENRHAYGPVHAITPGTWLSGTSARHDRETGHGITADQIAADHFGRHTRLPSIEAAAEEPRVIGTGAWAGDYGEGYSATISFRAASAPLAMEVSPRRLFDRLVARGSTAETTATRARSRRSVLDLVAEDAAALPRRLGARDRTTLREYLDTIRDVECRIERVDALSLASLESPAEAEGAFTERQALMFDLMALAFRADLTRVGSFMMAAETSTMTYGHLGVPDPFHLLSHHQHDPAKIAALVRVQQHHTQVFARFVRTLAELPDGDGSILDRSLILYGSNMSDSHAHDHFPLPLAVVGGRCGTRGGARNPRYPDRTPVSNLLFTLLVRSGVPVTSFGDSTGECAGI
jgi:Protein of unknown function (DUF1552)